jgi:glycosyltransferase involved in cell wall biosynthesis
MDLSIIIPVYQVEKYIRPCLESVFQQGLDEKRFEVIIVNDGTKDQSMEVIADVIQQHNNIIVINQENQGLSVARNNGIAIAKGQYIIMPDSDDMLIEASLPTLLDIALKTKVDLIVADFIKMNDDKISEFETNYPLQREFKIKEKTGHELFLEDLDPNQCYVWRTMFRRNFIVDNHITFIPGIYYQDIPFTHECYLKAKRCIRTSWLLNIYRTERQGAATTLYSSLKAKHFIIAIANTWKLRHINGLSSNVLYKLEEDVYTSFRMMVYCTLYGIEQHSERNNIMDYLNSSIPDLYFSHSIKQRFLSFMIRKAPHFYFTLFEWQNKIRKQLAKL